MNNDTVTFSTRRAERGTPVDWSDFVKTWNDFKDEREDEVDRVISGVQSHLATRIVARLDQHFRERYRPEDYKDYADAPCERLDAACFMLWKIAGAVQKSSEPWLDVELELPDYIAIALLEAVEAVDATEARHHRRRHAPLLSEAEGKVHLKCATAIYKRCVTCRELAQLAHVVRKVRQSELATRGDPSFLWGKLRRGSGIGSASTEGEAAPYH